MLCDVGLDLGYDQIHIAMLFKDPENPERVLKEKAWNITNTRKAIEKLAQEELPKGCRIAVETSNTTWPVCEILQAAGHDVRVLGSHMVEYIGKSGKKSDRHDARSLAQLLSFTDLNTVWIPDKKTRDLRYLASYDQLIQRQITMLKNQIESVLARNLVRSELSCDFGSGGVAWLETVKTQLPEVERFQIDSAHELIRHLTKLRERIAQDMARMIGPEPQFIRMLQVEGIGLRSALHLRARIGTLQRFPTSRSLVSYFGIAPGSDQSGQHEGRPGITHLGHSKSRYILVQCAKAATKTDGRLRQFYSGMVFNRKKERNKATMAVGNKMLTILWHMHNNNENYRDVKRPLFRVKLTRFCSLLGIDESKLPADTIPDFCQKQKRGRKTKVITLNRRRRPAANPRSKSEPERAGIESSTLDSE